MILTTLNAAAADGTLPAVLENIFRSSRFPLSNEKDAQAHISKALTALGIDHTREHRLAPGDVLDFWIPSAPDLGAVIEVKMNRARAPEILKQVRRYAAHPTVQAIFLVTNKAMGLPSEIEGKPAYYFSLGRAWL
jgi:hypothetical protein